MWISILIYGWFANKYGLIITAGGEMYEITALLRAIAGLSLGCFCYRMANRLTKYLFSIKGKIIFTLLEISGYIVSLIIICRPWTGSGDIVTFFIIIAWLISVTITFSQVSYSSKINSKFVEPYAKNIAMFSTALYLCHGRMQSFVVNFIPSISSFEERIIPYYIFSILLAVLCVMFVKIFNCFFSKHQFKNWIFTKSK